MIRSLFNRYYKRKISVLNVDQTLKHDLAQRLFVQKKSTRWSWQFWRWAILPMTGVASIAGMMIGWTILKQEPVQSVDATSASEGDVRAQTLNKLDPNRYYTITIEDRCIADCKKSAPMYTTTIKTDGTGVVSEKHGTHGKLISAELFHLEQDTVGTSDPEYRWYRYEPAIKNKQVHFEPQIKQLIVTKSDDASLQALLENQFEFGNALAQKKPEDYTARGLSQQAIVSTVYQTTLDGQAVHVIEFGKSGNWTLWLDDTTGNMVREEIVTDHGVLQRSYRVTLSIKEGGKSIIPTLEEWKAKYQMQPDIPVLYAIDDRKKPSTISSAEFATLNTGMPQLNYFGNAYTFFSPHKRDISDAGYHLLRLTNHGLFFDKSKVRKQIYAITITQIDNRKTDHCLGTVSYSPDGGGIDLDTDCHTKADDLSEHVIIWEGLTNDRGHASLPEDTLQKLRAESTDFYYFVKLEPVNDPDSGWYEFYLQAGKFYGDSSILEKKIIDDLRFKID